MKDYIIVNGENNLFYQFSQENVSCSFMCNRYVIIVCEKFLQCITQNGLALSIMRRKQYHLESIPPMLFERFFSKY